MTYDWTVGAIGPFELTEYLGLALIWGALAVTAPFRAVGRQFERQGDTTVNLDVEGDVSYCVIHTL